jgi:tetratricopeptide (TPR) repeat protein
MDDGLSQQQPSQRSRGIRRGYLATDNWRPTTAAEGADVRTFATALSVLSAVILLVVPNAAFAENQDAVWCSGEAKLAPENWLKACTAVIESAASKTDRAIAHYNRARAYRSSGQNELAIADYSAAIKLLPDFAIAFQNRGVVQNALGHVDRAIADYSRAIKLQPDLGVAYNNRGVAYKATGQYARAIADLTKAIELDPQGSWAYNNRGDAYFKAGSWSKAIADYSLALALNPDLSYALFARGAAKTYRGDRVSGRADMAAAVKKNPDVAVEQARDGIAPGT